MAPAPAYVKILLAVGQIVLALFYGTLGTVFTLLHLLRSGREKFFRRVERPTPPQVALDPIYGEHKMLKLKSSNVTLHYVSKGTSDQPLMLFVHGFPECWYAWRYQMKYFSKNYRVVAIDQRGYGLSSKPSSIGDYKVELLARDVADVVEQLGHQSCVLVGHDWGAIVSWTVAMLYPAVVDKLIILNVPHPAAYQANLSLAQLRKSWYIFFYQTPFIPELFFQANDMNIFNGVFYTKPMGLINKGNINSEDLEVFKYTFAQKGTPRAAINYYRALFRNQKAELSKPVTMPVLIIWGCQDGALGEELADGSIKYCSDVQLKKIRNASHWVQQDEPDEVNRYMEAFLNEKSTSK
ncbi:unnamed protein product [Adineta ricciae]|uniref:AB hydrolase-1 domain-containing protein n=1 Tax=Adineta ricciae TaxID=249248 RepID=A0A814QI22_ADIRI|nr:unnamed protein product [Adineta ricciae]CAF1118818.1 unnamed protein product [Adineta ricciae]